MDELELDLFKIMVGNDYDISYQLLPYEELTDWESRAKAAASLCREKMCEAFNRGIDFKRDVRKIKREVKKSFKDAGIPISKDLKQNID